MFVQNQSLHCANRTEIWYEYKPVCIGKCRISKLCGSRKDKYVHYGFYLVIRLYAEPA
jgi:hypothetical protein